MNAARTYFKIMAPLFAVAAVFHAWRIVSPDPLDPSPPLRHALFVGINLFVAARLWSRPSQLKLAFGVLVVQQLGSHGGAAWRAWVEHGVVDVVSLIIVILLPVTWILLIRYRE